MARARSLPGKPAPFTVRIAPVGGCCVLTHFSAELDFQSEDTLNIHEYQAKAILKTFGAPVSAGFPALTPEEAVEAAKKLPGPLYVVKSQIHAGGRGKGKFKELSAEAKGGVRLAFNIDEVKSHATEMLGHTLVTVQTGPHGKQVNRLYIEDGSDIEKEFYLSMLVDRETSRVAFVVSTEGGMDIEGVAHDTPEKIHSFSSRPCDRHPAASWPAGRQDPRPHRRSCQAGGYAGRPTLQGLRRD